MIGICFLAAATKNRRIPETAASHPAVESPKRVPDRQTCQPSFVLGGQYPITGNYVNPRSVFKQGWTLAPAGAMATVFTLAGCPSIFLGTVSLSNRKKDRR